MPIGAFETALIRYEHTSYSCYLEKGNSEILSAVACRSLLTGLGFRFFCSRGVQILQKTTNPTSKVKPLVIGIISCLEAKCKHWHLHSLFEKVEVKVDEI